MAATHPVYLCPQDCRIVLRLLREARANTELDLDFRPDPDWDEGTARLFLARLNSIIVRFLQ
jgi:hypothetical protein